MSAAPKWKSIPAPEVGSLWIDQRWGGGRTARVMAIAEGYVMVRFTGNMPFIVHLNDWYAWFFAKPLTSRAKAETSP